MWLSCKVKVDAANRSYFGTAIRGGLSPFPGVPVPFRWALEDVLVGRLQLILPTNYELRLLLPTVLCLLSWHCHEVGQACVDVQASCGLIRVESLMDAANWICALALPWKAGLLRWLSWRVDIANRSWAQVDSANRVVPWHCHRGELCLFSWCYHKVGQARVDGQAPCGLIRLMSCVDQGWCCQSSC